VSTKDGSLLGGRRTSLSFTEPDAEANRFLADSRFHQPACVVRAVSAAPTRFGEAGEAAPLSCSLPRSRKTTERPKQIGAKGTRECALTKEYLADQRHSCSLG
jgi:hypothetical protein